jgi:hypothetical protein
LAAAEVEENLLRQLSMQTLLQDVRCGLGTPAKNPVKLRGRTQLETEAASWQRLAEAVGLILQMSEGGAE